MTGVQTCALPISALEYLLKTSSKGVVFFGKGRLIAEPATGEIDMEIVK